MRTSRAERERGNELVRAIEEAHLQASEFDIQRSFKAGRLEFTVTHSESGARFTTDNCPDSYDLEHRVVCQIPDRQFADRRYVEEWSPVVQTFRHWLEEVKEYVETPDLVAELHQEIELLRRPFDAGDDSPFSPEEQAEIVNDLEQLRSNARAVASLTEGQLTSLEAKIDYLTDAVKRLGRTDWRGVFIGAITSWILGDAIPTETARHILRGVGHVLWVRYPGLPLPGS